MSSHFYTKYKNSMRVRPIKSKAKMLKREAIGEIAKSGEELADPKKVTFLERRRDRSN